MSQSTYDRLVAAGAPPLPDGIKYKITVDDDGDLRVRVVQPRKTWWNTNDKVLGEAYGSLWHYKREESGAWEYAAEVCRDAFNDWDATTRRNDVEGDLLGRHP